MEKYEGECIFNALIIKKYLRSYYEFAIKQDLVQM